MRVRYQFLTFLTGVFLTIFILGRFRLSGFLDRILPIAVVALFFSGLGWLIGMIIYELKLKPVEKRTKIYLIGNVVSLLGFTALMISLYMPEKDEAKVRRNREADYMMMENPINASELGVKLAYKKLETQFADPDNFSLSSYSTRAIDTVVDGSRDTLVNVYFTYYRHDEKDNSYLSKVSVLHGAAVIRSFDLDPSGDDEYIQIRAGYDVRNVEALKELREALDQLPDSVRQRIRTTVDDALSN